jgi:CheY-like chemotaxis protein
MVTTKSEADIHDACVALGCTSFVTKPINQEELRTRVREAVGG